MSDEGTSKRKRKQIDVDARKAKFEEYFQHMREAEDARAIVKEAEIKASTTLKEILDTYGKGLYKIAGKEVTIAKEREADRYYLREPNKRSADEI